MTNTQRIDSIETALATILAALNPSQQNANMVADVPNVPAKKGKAKRAQSPIVAGLPSHLAKLAGHAVEPAKIQVKDVTVDFAKTLRELAPLCIEGIKQGHFNGKVIPFGVNDPEGRPDRIDYRVYLQTPANRRFKADRRASGVPMMDACIALADAVESLPVK